MRSVLGVMDIANNRFWLATISSAAWVTPGSSASVVDALGRFIGIFGLPVIAVQPLAMKHAAAVAIFHLYRRDSRMAAGKAQVRFKKAHYPKFCILILHCRILDYSVVLSRLRQVYRTEAMIA